jgi:hypothetical protein
MEPGLKPSHRLLAACAALIAACACSPEAEAPAPEPEPAAAEARTANGQTNAARPAEPDRSASAPAAPKQAKASARRCGWLHNPTPGNWWLVDSDGQWILGTQGGHQAPGLHEMPDMSAGEWVEANGHYGYGCACMDVATDPATGHVTQVTRAESKPLAQCRADRKLPSPDAG